MPDWVRAGLMFGRDVCIGACFTMAAALCLFLLWHTGRYFWDLLRPRRY